MEASWLLGALSALVLIHTCAAIPGQAVIYSISPTAGSVNGGTRLTILGAGFQRDNVTGVYGIAYGLSDHRQDAGVHRKHTLPYYILLLHKQHGR